MCEHAFETLKQGNSLQSINSANYNIVMSFILFDIIAALLKFYLMICALVRKGKNLFTLSFLKVQIKTHLYDDFINKLCKIYKSALYDCMDCMDCMNATIERIFKYCRRSRVPMRDQQATKNYPLIFAEIASQCGSCA